MLRSSTATPAIRGCAAEDGAAVSISGYQDADKVSGWAADAMAWACSEGLITGTTASDGSIILDPQGSAVRAQAATILMRFIQNCL